MGAFQEDTVHAVSWELALAPLKMSESVGSEANKFHVKSESLAEFP